FGGFLFLFLEFRKGGFDNSRLDFKRVGVASSPYCFAYFLRKLIAASQKVLNFSLESSPPGIELQNLACSGLQAPPRPAAVEGGRVIANRAQVEHFRKPSGIGTALIQADSAEIYGTTA